MLSRQEILTLLLAAATASTAVASSNANKTPCYGFFGCDDGASTPTKNEDEDNRECTGFRCPDEAVASATSTEDDPGAGFNTLGSCTPVAFEMTTDSSPRDLSFDLTCNDAPIWTYPSATFPAQSTNGKITVKSCVFLEHACCNFNVHHNAENAALELHVDGQTALSYNSINDPPFTSISKTFGQTCEATPQVSVTPKDIPQDVDCKFGLERPLRFKITLDEHPEEISWFLVCHDPKSFQSITVFDTPRGSLAGHVGQTAEEKACIPYDTTCAFTIVDSSGDGLTMEGSGYTLTLGVALLDAYTTDPFTEKSYCIGDLCGSSYDKKSSPSTVPEEVERTTTVDVNQDTEVEAMEQVAEQLEEELEEEEEAKEKQEKELKELEKDLENLKQQGQEGGSDSMARAEEKTKFTKEEVEQQEEGDSSSVWLAPALGVVGVAVVFAGCVTYFLNTKTDRSWNGSSSRRSSAAARALSPMKDGMNEVMDETDSTENDDDDDTDTFVLDA